MEPNDDRSAAEEIRALREDQRRSRSSAIMILLVLVAVVVIGYAAWEGDREAERIGDCFRRGTPIEQC